MANAFSYTVSYGKQGVAVYRVHAAPLRHITPIPESPFVGRENALLACEIDVEVFGDEFLPAYTHGDNRLVVATDSMKNFIIRESLTFRDSTLESLLFHLGTRFTAEYPQLHTLALTGRELGFDHVAVPDGEGAFVSDNNIFRAAGPDRAHARLHLKREASGPSVTSHECGLTGIALMKLTGSAFTSFVRDGYTTLPERGDRPLYISMDIAWQYGDPWQMLDPKRGAYVPAEQVRDLISATFASFVSESIQHLLHEIGSRLMARFPQLAEVRFDALNRTRDPYGQRENEEHVRVYSDPFPAYGRLTLSMRRDSA